MSGKRVSIDGKHITFDKTCGNGSPLSRAKDHIIRLADAKAPIELLHAIITVIETCNKLAYVFLVHSGAGSSE